MTDRFSEPWYPGLCVGRWRKQQNNVCSGRMKGRQDKHWLWVGIEHPFSNCGQLCCSKICVAKACPSLKFHSGGHSGLKNFDLHKPFYRKKNITVIYMIAISIVWDCVRNTISIWPLTVIAFTNVILVQTFQKLIILSHPLIYSK